MFQNLFCSTKSLMKSKLNEATISTSRSRLEKANLSKTVNHVRSFSTSPLSTSLKSTSFNSKKIQSVRSFSTTEANSPGTIGPIPMGTSSLGKGVSLIDENFLDSSGKRRIQVRGYGEQCMLVDEVLVNQSVLLLPHGFLLWDAKRFEDITIESLQLFEVLFPTIEILCIGCGEIQPEMLSPEIVDHFRKKGIVVEASNTVNASTVFNVLNEEGRNVGAALLTLQPTDVLAVRIPGEFDN